MADLAAASSTLRQCAARRGIGTSRVGRIATHTFTQPVPLSIVVQRMGTGLDSFVPDGDHRHPAEMIVTYWADFVLAVPRFFGKAN